MGDGGPAEAGWRGRLRRRWLSAAGVGGCEFGGFGCGIAVLVRFSVVVVASGATTKAARRAARVAAVAAQEELARRTRANMEDLAVFFSARERADAVDEWLAERVAALQAQAAQRRDGHRLQCGIALRSMRDRGQSVREIAAMAGVGEKAVRDLIRAAAASSSASASDEPPPGEMSVGTGTLHT
jgi:hypothetical protein